MCMAGGAGMIGPMVGMIGGVFSAIGQAQQLEAKAQAAEYNAAVARNNATAEANKGAFEVEMRREKNRDLLARQRAGFGVSGALAGTGTPLTVFAETMKDANMDAAAAQWDARVKTEAQIAQQQLFLHEASNARKAKSMAMLGIIGSDARHKPCPLVTPFGVPGLEVYIYRWEGCGPVRAGFMAQDVARIRPDAVLDINGVLHIDYDKLAA